MTGLDYNVALAVFFPFYVAAEIPSNMMIKRYRPSLWIAFIMASWSIVMICMGLVTSYEGLLATRIFLGIAEGGFFPGVTYYITQWYKRHECGLRMALFFSAATAAGAFGGLLARGISAMDGILGRGGWSWIFILEGCLTLIFACCSYRFINDYLTTSVHTSTPICTNTDSAVIQSYAYAFFPSALNFSPLLSAEKSSVASRKIETISQTTSRSSMSGKL